MHQRVKLTGHPKAVMPSSLLSSALRPGKRQQVQEPEAVDAPPVDVGSSEDEDEDEKDVAATTAPNRSRAKPGLRPPMPTSSKGGPRSGRGADDVKPARLSRSRAKAAPRPDIPPERRSARQQAAATTTTTVSLKRGSHSRDSVSPSSGSSSLSELEESANREAAVRASPKKKIKITAADKRPGSGPASIGDDENQLPVPLRPTRKPQTTYAGRRQHGKSATLSQHSTPAESSARPVPRHGRLKLDSDPERDRTGQRLHKTKGIISSSQLGTGKTAINNSNEDGHARPGARADPKAGSSRAARQKGAGGGRARPTRKADQDHDEAPAKPLFEKHKVDLDEGDNGDDEGGGDGDGDGDGDAPPRKAHAEDDDHDSVLSSPPPEEDDGDDSDDDLSPPPALDRSPSTLSPSKPACPLCGEPVELARLDEFSGGSRIPINRQAEFCHSHRLGSAQDEWRTRKYPEIDWPRLEARIESHRVALQGIIEGRSPSHFAARLAGESAKSDGGGLVPGYYGPRGCVAMSEILTRQFDQTLAGRAAAAVGRLLAGRDTGSYVQAVLVPEAALRLIMEDMAVGGEEEAREIMRDSAWIGELVHAAGGGCDALHGAEDESELSDLSYISD